MSWVSDIGKPCAFGGGRLSDVAEFVVATGEGHLQIEERKPARHLCMRGWWHTPDSFIAKPTQIKAVLKTWTCFGVQRLQCRSKGTEPGVAGPSQMIF
jgi:hypothetical protein